MKNSAIQAKQAPLFQGKVCPKSQQYADCAAYVIAAPHSGSGKTTITAALARYHSNQGRKVCVFKVGPDFIDPMILCQASGALVYQLDLWLVGEQGCQALLYQAAAKADIILIEGVMGLFDGTPSSADLATFFKIPVLAVIDAKAMAQTFAAVSFGLANFRQQLPFAGVIANRVNSQRHSELLAKALDESIHYFGRMPTDSEITLPERHLGLVQAKELADIDRQLNKAASHIAQTLLTELADTNAKVRFYNSVDNQQQSLTQRLSGTKIIVIKDSAFSFIYAANIDFLTQHGADICYCSALEDSHLPEGDVLYIPGGYPELYAEKLMHNTSFLQQVRAFAEAGKPIVAECGGMLYLLEQLTDFSGKSYQMLGLLPGQAKMQDKLSAIGSQWVDLAPVMSAQLCSGIDASENQVMRGHSFHYSSAEVQLDACCQTTHHPSLREGEFVYKHHNILASYMHWYLPSNPELSVQLFHRDRRL